MILSWMSDIHLDAVNYDIDYLSQDVDGYLITGDISTGKRLIQDLDRLRNVLKKPIYFVCGNHDFYGSSIRRVTTQLRNTAEGRHYLPNGPRLLEGSTWIVGQDGWYDLRNGKGSQSKFTLCDLDFVHELRESIHCVGARSTTSVIRQLADTQALALEAQIREVVSKGATKVVVATHVPPFQGSCFHEGKPSDPDGLPWFSSKIMGDTLESLAKEYPNVLFEVYAGHTHASSTFQVTPNMVCRVARASYGYPEFQVIEV